MKNHFRKAIILILLPMLIQTAGYAQQKGNEQMDQMLDLSRPGSNHALFNQLVGTWNFQDAKLKFVKGTLLRKPVYDGRFFSTETTGGKLALPIADGKMKNDNYRSMQIEGYDNARMKFYTTSINNHIGSDIQQQVGTYDAAKKEFSYEWESELIKGQPKKYRRVVKILDGDHYNEIYYEEQSGQYVKTRELDYSRWVPTDANSQQTPAENESPIQLTVSKIEDAWNRHDAKDYSAAFAREADFTNVLGDSEHGRAKVEVFHAPMFATIFKNSHVKHVVSKVRFIKPDVAAVDVKWEMTGATHSDGSAWPDRKGLISYIMVPEDGAWKVLIMHNSEFQ